MAYRQNSLVRQLEIEYLPIGDLIFDVANVRKHSKSQISKLAAGIRAFGFTNPIQIDEHNRLIAGEARLRAAPMVPLEGAVRPTGQLLAAADEPQIQS